MRKYNKSKKKNVKRRITQKGGEHSSKEKPTLKEKPKPKPNKYTNKIAPNVENPDLDNNDLLISKKKLGNPILESPDVNDIKLFDKDKFNPFNAFKRYFHDRDYNPNIPSPISRAMPENTKRVSISTSKSRSNSRSKSRSNSSSKSISNSSSKSKENETPFEEFDIDLPNIPAVKDKDNKPIPPQLKYYMPPQKWEKHFDDSMGSDYYLYRKYRYKGKKTGYATWVNPRRLYPEELRIESKKTLKALAPEMKTKLIDHYKKIPEENRTILQKSVISFLERHKKT